MTTPIPPLTGFKIPVTDSALDDLLLVSFGGGFSLSGSL